MTRYLSHALQAAEPAFSHGLSRLEAANGKPNSDIRLSQEVIQTTNNKLRELGLDPNDTTAEELYHVLQMRVKQDDSRLNKTLRTKAAKHISAEADVVAGMIHVLKELPDSKRCFAMKSSRLKSLIKNVPPKKAMRRLGYRSMESFLKHEAPISIVSAAWLVEGETWQKRFLDQYKKLQPGDFESRNIQILQMNSTRWTNLASEIVEQTKHNLLCFKELGALVFLPLNGKVPEGAATISLCLALHELNEIRACSTYLKLSQVKPDFGRVTATIARDEPRLSSEMLDQAVPWHLIHRYYSKLTDRFRSELFEPYLQLEDMVWKPIENTLAEIEPKMKFWQQTAHLGMLDNREPVSLNIVDAATNFCNDLPYQKRVVDYFQRSLWHELLLRYLHHQPVEDSILNELQPEFATEKILA
jgi:hypothetical protein